MSHTPDTIKRDAVVPSLPHPNFHPLLVLPVPSSILCHPAKVMFQLPSPTANAGIATLFRAISNLWNEYRRKRKMIDVAWNQIEAREGAASLPLAESASLYLAQLCVL
jgi:hypothetical protein